MTVPFVSLTNFLDPLSSTDYREYQYSRFKQLVQECYAISKNCNTSYTDVKNLSCQERDLLVSFIKEELDYKQEKLEEVKQQQQQQYS